MYRVILLVTFACYIQYGASQQTDTNCTTAVETYMRSFMELEISNATNDQKCLELNDTFQFLKNQSCVTDVYLRLLFVQAGDRLANYSCNVTAITNAIYPALAPEGKISSHLLL
ncbi:uncharacterized protein LOC129925636 [Biomphalaria glabrata]|uniref:Uncharacterized protein LOC129925636 n=1 Tax=Biomphalaria glabrata TaxID=6526 RepID=A0A9W3A237_BIOGL|nr:uncharacterized protein LOC129925636 [Biomphalaria glabrata]